MSNPINVQRYLSGVNYPASREDLVEHAKSQGADEQTLETLREMPQKTFDGPSGVSAAVGAE